MQIQKRDDLGGAISPRPGWEITGTRQELTDLAYAIQASLSSVQDKTITASSGNYAVNVTNRAALALATGQDEDS